MHPITNGLMTIIYTETYIPKYSVILVSGVVPVISKVVSWSDPTRLWDFKLVVIMTFYHEVISFNYTMTPVINLLKNYINQQIP